MILNTVCCYVISAEVWVMDGLLAEIRVWECRKELFWLRLLTAMLENTVVSKTSMPCRRRDRVADMILKNLAAFRKGMKEVVLEELSRTASFRKKVRIASP